MEMAVARTAEAALMEAERVEGCGAGSESIEKASEIYLEAAKLFLDAVEAAVKADHRDRAKKYVDQARDAAGHAPKKSRMADELAQRESQLLSML
jgi:hypothetical protein